MNPLRWLVRTVVRSSRSIVMWSATDEEKEDWLQHQLLLIAIDEEDEDEDEEMGEEETLLLERDAAYLTTGLITAIRAVNTAHEEGVDCSSHHDAAVALLQSVNNPMTAIRVIQHLLEIVAATVDDEDVQQMVATIVATELDEDKDDPRHHHH